MIKKVRIEIKRSSFWIHNFEMPIGKDFQNCTSYSLFKTIANVYDPRARMYRCTLDLYDKRNKILKIPAGYGINNILEYLSNSYHEVVWDIEDKHKEFVDYYTTNLEMRPGYEPRDKIQIDAINFLSSCVTDEYTEGKGHQLYLSLDTGMGKTFCTIYTLVKLKLPAIIISYNLSDQWVEKIKEYVKIKDSDIFVIRGSESIKKILTSEKTYPFYIASVSTLRRFSDMYKNLNLLFDRMKIAVKVFDEAHNQYKANSFIDVNSDVRYTFYLTATPGRSSYLEDRVYKNIFATIPIHGVYTHTLKNYYKIKYLKYDTRPSYNDRRSCSTQKGFSAINYFNYLFRNEEKKLAIVGMIKYYADKILIPYPKHRVLVFIPSLEFMDYLYKFLTNNYNLPYTVGQYCSNIKNIKDREEMLNKNLIITTIAAGSTGKDIPNLKAVISMTPFSSSILCRQILGRLRELKDGGDSYFLDFTDIGFSSAVKQRYLRSGILNQRAASTEEKFINLNDMILYLKENMK